jgi:hypothetical protein
MIERTGRVALASFPSPFGTAKVDLRNNPDFISESLIAYEAGYRWQIKRNLSVDLAAFYNVYDDLYGVGTTTNPFDPDLEFQNNQEGTGMASNSPLPGRQVVRCRSTSAIPGKSLIIDYKDPATYRSHSAPGRRERS